MPKKKKGQQQLFNFGFNRSDADREQHFEKTESDLVDEKSVIASPEQLEEKKSEEFTDINYSSVEDEDDTREPETLIWILEKFQVLMLIILGQNLMSGA